MPREDRNLWADGLPIKPFEESTEYLYFVGCTPSYDPRIQKVAQALVRLLATTPLNYGYLGSEESCCGSEVRRLGEAGLFEMIVEDTTELYKNLGVSKMFTTSPHCFNAYKNDFPVVAGEKSHPMQVQHYTQVLASLIERGELKFSGSLEKTITYHDPCYLGKHNGVFDEPREVLSSIPGVNLVEMDRSREKSLCCEGGGGRMWLEGTNPGTRLAQQRIQEALDTGAQVLATACPFCLATLDEAVKHLNADDKLQVMDIAELAAQAL
jgi:Fe-S oxidoreductase